jgi:hypothetical protein
MNLIFYLPHGPDLWSYCEQFCLHSMSDCGQNGTFKEKLQNLPAFPKAKK